MMLSLTGVSPESGAVRCCCLSKIGMVEKKEIRQVMWLVMLEYAKDRIFGVDTPR
jgi:hypothetical protein